VPYSGSLAEHVLVHERPEFIRQLSSEAGRISADLVAACPDCAALAVPLEDADEAIGALILLRDHGSFRPEEADRAATFADLAALAFRKVHLLEESERQRKELAAVIESRSILIRGFSHDVKNPIGAADGFLSLLESGVYENLEEAKDVIARARRALHDGLKLIEDLLELAKAEAGQIAVEYDTVDIAEVVKEIAESQRVQAESKGLALDVEIEPELPPVQSDASRLRQVLGNLLSNAVKYTREGRISIRASVRDNREAPAPGRWIALEVRDTGPGIPEEQQKLIFEEFKRLDTAGTERGSGIGLAIGRRVARILHGEITVKSTPGVGSTFTLWLPATE
jgi:signal transduction histidine kinase